MKNKQLKKYRPELHSEIDESFIVNGFHGDFFIQSEFLKLRDKYNIESIIETGTFEGNTTKWLARFFQNVYTIEIDIKYVNNAIANCMVYKDKINFLHGDSSILLPEVLDKINDDNVLIFLDAHRRNENPLEKELVIIEAYKKKFKNIIIIIHDFYVPDTKLGYDTFMDRPLSFDWFKDKFDLIYENNYTYYYNTTDRVTSINRGIIYLIGK